jgi:hypothetical protein
MAPATLCYRLLLLRLGRLYRLRLFRCLCRGGICIFKMSYRLGTCSYWSTCMCINATLVVASA